MAQAQTSASAAEGALAREREAKATAWDDGAGGGARDVGELRGELLRFKEAAAAEFEQLKAENDRYALATSLLEAQLAAAKVAAQSNASEGTIAQLQGQLQQVQEASFAAAAEAMLSKQAALGQLEAMNAELARVRAQASSMQKELERLTGDSQAHQTDYADEAGVLEPATGGQKV